LGASNEGVRGLEVVTGRLAVLIKGLGNSEPTAARD